MNTQKPLPIYLPIFLSCFWLIQCTSPKSEENYWISRAPAGSEYCTIQEDGKSILPNGRILTPRGKTLRIAPHPYGLVLSPDGGMAISANSGNRPFSLSFISELLSDTPSVRQIPEGSNNDEDLLGAVFMGLAVSPDNKILYASGGQENKIYLFNPENGEKLGEIDCAVQVDGRDYTQGYIGDLCLDEEGETLYALDQIGFG